MVDRRLHHRAVKAQLPPARHREPARQGDHAVVERDQRRGRDDVGPAQKGGVVGHLLQVDAAELAQDEAVGHEALDLLVAPPVEPLDDEQTQDDLDRRTRPPQGQAARPAPRHVSLDPANDLVVLEQPIQLRQFGFEGLGQSRHEPEQPHRRVAIDDHGSPSRDLRIREPPS
jgi:hypothetical protein